MKNQKTKLTPLRLKALVKYHKKTGVFLWTKQAWVESGGKRKLAVPIGTAHASGHLAVRIDKKIYYLHRLAWLYVFGVVPYSNIDHIDGDPSNNAFTNLRLATPMENAENQRAAHAGNRSGFLGVTWLAANNKWRAQIKHRQKLYGLGSFITPEAAYKAYVKAKRRLHTHGML